ncbi:MAG: GDP-mannose 4,6-dehydratase [Planctomycetota bacterium]|jgi:NAD dependent epimerase/dehydratase
MRNKTLITGATGFIGSYLTELCVEQGYNVRAYDRYNPNNDWGWLEDSPYKNSIEVILGDIRDYDSVYDVMKGCDTVFHLAALISIPYSYLSPLAYIRTNIEGTYNVLESAKRLGISHLLITSTSETYGTAQYVPIDESHPILGQSPYAASKIGADQLAISYYRSFELPIKIVRPFNTYGPRQSTRAITATIISQLLNSQGRIKLGNVATTRDFTFIKDTVKGFIEIHKSENLFGEITNIGLNEEISIADLVKLIAGLMGKHAEFDIDKERIRPQRSEVERLRCDNSKLIKNTSWRPEYTLESGLKETIQWMESNSCLLKSDIYGI